MPEIKAFKCIRPDQKFVKDVAALPYDVMNSEEARKIVQGNQYSFLHVDKAEIDLPEDINIYDKKVYEKAKENLYGMIDQGIFKREDKECLYIYRQNMNGRIQTGIVACTSIDDYINDRIKKHEHTRKDKEQDRTNHVDYCNANTGPIFLTYRNNIEITNIVKAWTEQNKPVYDFVSEDGIGHTAWIIDDQNIIGSLKELFKNVDDFYIADGHHRAASAVSVGKLRREQNKDYTGKEEFNYFLSVIFPDEDLYIMDYNRVVKDLNGLSVKEFMVKISVLFDIEECSQKFKPTAKHTYGMYLEGKWYKLTPKQNTFDENDPVSRLDVSILQNNLLNPILGIEDPRTDKRIDFIGGIRGLDELVKRAESDMKVAFSMYPTTIDDLMAIADAGRVMPPKSTWFEPKLRSGIFIHELG
jgi:uncharacterized protein (DUF1015 family)